MSSNHPSSTRPPETFHRAPPRPIDRVQSAHAILHALLELLHSARRQNRGQRITEPKRLTLTGDAVSGIQELLTHCLDELGEVTHAVTHDPCSRTHWSMLQYLAHRTPQQLQVIEQIFLLADRSGFGDWERVRRLIERAMRAHMKRTLPADVQIPAQLVE